MQFEYEVFTGSHVWTLGPQLVARFLAAMRPLEGRASPGEGGPQDPAPRFYGLATLPALALTARPVLL